MSNETYNTWDDIEPVLAAIKSKRWSWYRNPRCKYIDIRIDMRDKKCIVKDRNGVRINPKDVAFQKNLKD